MKAALPLLLLAVLTGCASLAPPAVRPGPMDEPPPLVRSTMPRVSGGSDSTVNSTNSTSVMEMNAMSRGNTPK